MNRRDKYTRAAVRAGELPVVEVRGQGLVYRERVFVPLWASLLGGLLGFTWRVLVRFGWAVVRHPVRSVVLFGLLVLWRRAGLLVVVVLVALVLVVAVVWWRRWPSSFERHVRRRVRSWWRWRRIYRRGWRELMAGCGLVETTDTGDTLPQIARLTSHRHRDDLVVVLPAGQVPDDLVTAAEALAHGLRAWNVTARSLGRGRVALTVHGVDPLEDPTPPPGDGSDDPDGPGGGRMTGEGVLRRLAAVLVGVTEAGGPWTLALTPGRHLLVSGSTGSGKSGLLWAIVWDLADLIRDGWVTITAFDPKYVELRALADVGLGVVHTHVPSMPDQLEALVAELDERCQQMTTRTHLPSRTEPVRLVVIDELATLTALAETKNRRRVEDALGHLLSRGRAAGYEVILTSVEATKDVVRWRGLCATRVCYRTDDDGAADLVLGDGARDRGAATELIPETTPGVAYTRTEGRRDIARVRTLHITDDQITRLAHPAASAAPADPPAADGPVPASDAAQGSGQDHQVITLPVGTPTTRRSRRSVS